MIICTSRQGSVWSQAPASSFCRCFSVPFEQSGFLLLKAPEPDALYLSELLVIAKNVCSLLLIEPPYPEPILKLMETWVLRFLWRTPRRPFPKPIL